MKRHARSSLLLLLLAAARSASGQPGPGGLDERVERLERRVEALERRLDASGEGVEGTGGAAREGEGAAAAEEPSTAIARASFQGRVVRISEDSIVLESGEEGRITLDVGPQTRIWLQGERVARDAVRPGAAVEVEFDLVDGDDVATAIVVEPERGVSPLINERPLPPADAPTGPDGS